MRKMKFVICMLLFLNSCAHLKIKSNQASQSSDEGDASDEKVEKIWLEYFDILNNGELKDVLSFMKPLVIFTFNNQTIETEDYDQLFSLLKQWKNNKNKQLYPIEYPPTYLPHPSRRPFHPSASAPVRG